MIYIQYCINSIKYVLISIIFIGVFYCLNFIYQYGYLYVLSILVPNKLHYSNYGYYIMVINFIGILIISIVGLYLFNYRKKRSSRQILLFLFSSLALFIVFSNILLIWKDATFSSCNLNAYALTNKRFFSMSLKIIGLLYSICPIYYIFKYYKSQQVIITIVVYVMSLYLYTIFIGGYFMLYLLN